MKEDNLFLVAKAVITGTAASYGAAFGWLGWLILAWIACMALDWLTGSFAACRKGAWASGIARDGIFHKGGMLIIVIVAAIADGVLGMLVSYLPNVSISYTTAVLPVVLVWYIFTELGSIAENATKMGASVPTFLTKLLAAAADATDGNRE